MPEDLLLFLSTRIKKLAVWKTKFVSEHSNTDQQPHFTKCLHSLHALPVAVLAIPDNSAARTNYAKRAKHIVDCLPDVFFDF